MPINLTPLSGVVCLAPVVKTLLDLDPEDSTPCILLSKFYAGAGRWDGIERMLSLIKDQNLEKGLD